MSNLDGERPHVIRHGQAKLVALPPSVTLGDGPPASGKALHFGKEAAVELPNVAEIDTDKPFTIATWVTDSQSESRALRLASQIGSEEGRR